MLVETAIADAYAIAWEFCNNPQENDLKGFYQHPRYHDMIPGHYTDDTQRSLANAMVILNKPREKWFDVLTYVQSYQDVFRHDPRAGYSRRYEAFLKENLTVSPEEFALKLKRRNTNGAVMGAAIFGYLSTPEEVMLASAVQALSTHNYETIPQAQIVALSCHHFLRGGLKADLPDFLNEHLVAHRDVVDTIAWSQNCYVGNSPVKMISDNVVDFLLSDAIRFNNLTDIILRAVDRGGDTDSSAAVSVAVLSNSIEVVNDIPEVLYQQSENLDHLKTVDDLLRKTFV
jgi:ADP-ribosylglycohydrolase